MNSTEKHVLLPERKVEGALAALHRSVSARQFYPADHPQLAAALRDGYRAWEEAQADYRLSEPGLDYRSGALWLGEERMGPTNPAVTSLARTLATHGLVRVRRTGELTLEGFSHLVGLLATAPDVLGPRGGLAEVWRRSSWGEALELKGVRVGVAQPRSPARSSATTQWGQGLSGDGEVAALADPALVARLHAFKQKGPRERRILDLLLRLGRIDDMTAFLDVLREITRLVDDYLDMERFREAYHIVLYLFREAQNFDALGEAGRRDYLMDTIRVAMKGPFLGWLIQTVATTRGDEDAEVGEYVLRALGGAAVVPLLNALVAERSRMGRRRLLDVLVAVGQPVVAPALRLLEDQRWYVVRNMVTILGGVGAPEGVRAILRLADDPDSRIRREVARALGRVEAPRVEDKLSTMLHDRDPAVRVMAVSAAVGHRTPRMLEALWSLFQELGIRSNEWDLKPVILQAIGRMGLPEAVGKVAGVLRKKGLLHRDRWRIVHKAAIQALGDLGGPDAQEILDDLKAGPDAEVRMLATRALAVATGREDGV